MELNRNPKSYLQRIAEALETISTNGGGGGTEREVVVENTTFTSEQLEQAPFYVGNVSVADTSWFDPDTNPTIYVTYDGQEYILPYLEGMTFYGEFDNQGPSFEHYPLVIGLSFERPNYLTIATSEAGEHTIQISVEGSGLKFIVRTVSLNLDNAPGNRQVLVHGSCYDPEENVLYGVEGRGAQNVDFNLLIPEGSYSVVTVEALQCTVSQTTGDIEYDSDSGDYRISGDCTITFDDGR